MKNLAILIVCSLLLFSCIKNKTTTIEGILMAGCDTPAANTSGTIKTDDGFGVQGESLSFTTDENGYFKVSYTGNKNLDKFRVIAGGGEVLSVWNLPGREKDLGRVYINPFPTNFIIKLDVRNPYTENDTLVMFDFKNPNAMPSDAVYFPGPFTSGILDSIINYNFRKFPIQFSTDVSSGPIFTIRHIVRSFPSNMISDEYTDFNLAPICSAEFAEVTLVIE